MAAETIKETTQHLTFKLKEELFALDIGKGAESEGRPGSEQDPPSLPILPKLSQMPIITPGRLRP